MKKVFVSNFDGTLYIHDADGPGRIPAEYADRIREYHEAGNLFGLCTGRQLDGVVPYVEGSVPPDFFITSGGANIVDYHYHEIRKLGLDPNVLAEILSQYGERGYWYSMDVDGHVCVYREMKFADFAGDYYVCTSIDDVPRGRTHQLSIHTYDPDKAAELTEEISLWYGDSVKASQNGGSVDITPRGCHKGEAVNFMREYISRVYGGIRVYSAGDSMSDMPILAAADVSYTFPYAPRELQERATKVVPTLADALADSMKEE